MGEEADPDVEGGTAPNSKNLEELRKWKAKRARLEYERLEGVLIPRAQVREGLLLTAVQIRKGGEKLLKRFGPEAAKVLDDALDAASRRFDRHFGKHNEEKNNDKAD